MRQEPREKLEPFPKLGYYFIVFRAIESRIAKESFAVEHNGDEKNWPDDGVVGGANVYLVVFNEGICSVRHDRYFSTAQSNELVLSFTSRISRVSFIDFPFATTDPSLRTYKSREASCHTTRRDDKYVFRSVTL